jgi:hypothetical protein
MHDLPALLGISESSRRVDQRLKRTFASPLVNSVRWYIPYRMPVPVESTVARGQKLSLVIVVLFVTANTVFSPARTTVSTGRQQSVGVSSHSTPSPPPEPPCLPRRSEVCTTTTTSTTTITCHHGRQNRQQDPSQVPHDQWIGR